ncbi:hypothetical protein BT93_B2763 [Corymbia citriodora subsp. variegata]|nr:hypothetical protein BT93_B2763 [Corymbia citriodora subsp. variegata]
MDLRDMGFDPTVLDTLRDILNLSDKADTKSHHAPSCAFLRGKKAMVATPADVKEYPNSYVFLVDMPGLKLDQNRVQVEDGNLLVVSRERKREKEKDLKERKDGACIELIFSSIIMC